MRLSWPSAVAALLLLAVLPNFGGGGQVRAAFVADSVVEIEAEEEVSWDSVLADFMRGEDGEHVRPTTDTSGRPPPEQPQTPPHATPRKGDRWALTGGGGGATSSSGGAGHGQRPSAGLVSDACPIDLTESGRLVLVESTTRPSSFGVRLFRPPR